MNYKVQLKKMVKEQIEARGIKDENVIKSMLNVPRHLFVPKNLISLAYTDRPLPIGEYQTISQPYMVAWMTELLRLERKDRVLEIGTGSGYQTAILAEMVEEVYTIERLPELLNGAKEILDKLGYRNIFFKLGDGTKGWEEFSPYDKIIVTAGAPDVPSPLYSQLKNGGRMVIPIGPRYTQDLKLIIKQGEDMKIEDAGGCVFVPLVGEFGWREEESQN